MDSVWKTDRPGRKYPIPIRRRRGDKTVGRKQDRAVEMRELLFLVRPRRSVVSDQMIELLETRMGMGDQHLAVSIHVHPDPAGLAKQQKEVAKIMTRNKDAGIFADSRRASTLPKRVLFEAGSQTLIDEVHDCWIGLSKRLGMRVLGGDAFQTEQQEGKEGPLVVVLD